MIKFVRNIYRNTKRIVEWIPVIWRDRDFDRGYLYTMLKYKLTRMADHFEEHKNFTGWEKIVEHIRECVQIIERLQKDEYIEKEMDDFREKVGWTVQSRRELSNEEKAEFWAIRARQCQARDDDKARLFEIMKEHIDEWWD
jgi:hypothetical protein